MIYIYIYIYIYLIVENLKNYSYDSKNSQIFKEKNIQIFIDSINY